MKYETIASELYGRDILSAKQFSREGLLELFSFAERMRPIAQRKVRTQVLGGYVMGSFFFKESTRTRLSSEAAFIRLGGGVITFTDPKFSSMVKLETFEDTIGTVDCYCDLMTLRLENEGQAAIAAKIAEHPVINGGDGSGEHPTQGLLDSFTLKESSSKDITREPFTIAMVGDLRYGRTVHSLVPMLMCLCDRVRFRFVAPDFLQLPQSILEAARQGGFGVDVEEDFLDGIREADAVYMVRPQLERMRDDEEREKWRSLESRFYLNRRIVEKECKPGILITHPLPRNAEISTDVDVLPNALYHKRQIENGVLIRMGAYIFILGKQDKFV